ncbi:RHS repeat-associated core domain-containing protein, partial [Chitinophaga sp.]|uniref:RHS repeat domain-containing protein n=1 Tax=Chitinophaga sp. TaxID=1869181 RepID=UPI002CAE0AF7
MIAQSSPDGGASHFWYDRLGRLAVSQNARQLLNNAYSYTLYDYIGRITEVGEILSSAAMTQEISQNAVTLLQWVNSAGSSRSQITTTVYDLPYIFPEGNIWEAKNLRNRVAWSAVYNHIADTIPGSQTSATYYSYDIHGNVRTLLQEYNAATPNEGNRFKKIAYTYDLISGNVNTVSYQPGQRDAFYHRYNYDAENRLTNVETSKDSIYWENDAYYQYYKHSPLARTVLGQQQVQGIDYAYTLQGWLKGVNSTAATSAFDIGKDGAAGGITARDAFGFALHYFGDDDYKPANANVHPFAAAGSALKPLYNGNIGAMSVNIPKVRTPLMYAYTYDALNRLVGMNTSHNLNATTNTWAPIAVQDFGETISYDPNGNILSYNRNGNQTWGGKPLLMDNLQYHYIPGKNQLTSIADNVPETNYANDIDNQSDNNYLYDGIGNLVHDEQAGIDVEWNIYGKIKQIKKKDNSTIVYTYDVAGNRISKIAKGIETRYIRDASGNVMSVYVSGDPSINNSLLSQTETHLYGSGRLGINNLAIQVQNEETPDLVRLQGLGFGTFATFIRGNKFFELSNHLGNVLSTVTDAKKAVSADGNTVDHYEADVASAQDYAPFGMGLDGRGFDAGRYRYGFNGKENDNEVKGEGNQQDYGMRIYDPRIGKFLSVDPLTKQYPHYTPYSFAGNKPIQYIDIDGGEEGARVIRMSPQLEVIRGGQYGRAYLDPFREVEFDANGHSYYEPDEVHRNLGASMRLEDLQKIKQLDFGINYEVINGAPASRFTAESHQLYMSAALDAAQKARVGTANDFFDKYLNKRTNRKDESEVYELRAKSAGWYTCYSCENVTLDNVHFRTDPSVSGGR